MSIIMVPMVPINKTTFNAFFCYMSVRGIILSDMRINGIRIYAIFAT